MNPTLAYMKTNRVVFLVDLARAMGITPHAAWMRLRGMIELGQVRKVQRGIYEWVARGTYEAMDSRPVSCQAHS